MYVSRRKAGGESRAEEVGTARLLSSQSLAAPTTPQNKLRLRSREGWFALQIYLSCFLLLLPTRDGLNNMYCSS